jgi:dCMP deaminase
MKTKTEKADGLYMRFAVESAKQSYAIRSKVGCVVVKDDRVLSIGYNGTPPGFPNECEKDGVTIPEVIHAEQNAIYKMARDGAAAKDSTIYVTLSPCYECAKAIITSGIKRLVYLEAYRDLRPVEFLQDRGVEVVNISLDNKE